MAVTEFFLGSDAAAHRTEEARAWAAEVRAPAHPVMGRRIDRQMYVFNAIFWTVLFMYYTGQMSLMESPQTPAMLSWRALLMLLAFTLCAPVGWVLLRILDWRLPA